MDSALRNYLVVTGGYWAFTLTDGAIRMLVVLYFHLLGYSPFEVAMLFLFYEFFGIVTNLVGGWMAARLGLNVTMHLGMALQIIALVMLTVPDPWLSVIYVMSAQALSGIAKDLNKMSAKASVKTLTANNANSSLFKWVSILTGSKNALKGVGFFLGAFLLHTVGFQTALAILAGGLFIVLCITWIKLPSAMGKVKSKPKFTQVFSNIPAINQLSAARFFLFGARDIWFVVALPVFLYENLHWDFTQIGAFIAMWIIAYGIVQASVPNILRGHQPNGQSALFSAILLAFIPAGIALALTFHTDINWDITGVIVGGLMIFGFVFAINSAIHSYLILAYSSHDNVSMNVGFYYMANAGGRLTGTVLSGLAYQYYGLIGCLWISAGFILITVLLSLALPKVTEI
jgi:predicted MFS family arabinose efflux permease